MAAVEEEDAETVEVREGVGEEEEGRVRGEVEAF